jgi:hypothetical protein
MPANWERSHDAEWHGRLAARIAFLFAYHDRHDEAHKTITELYEKAGTRGVLTALLAWVEMAIESTGQTPGKRQVIKPGWYCIDTGKLIDDADRVPPEARWAGRLVAARLAANRDLVHDLVRAIPDGDRGTAYIFAALDIAVLTTKLHRGELETPP